MIEVNLLVQASVDPAAFSETDALHAMQQEQQPYQHGSPSRPTSSQAQYRQAQHGNQRGHRSQVYEQYDRQSSHQKGRPTHSRAAQRGYGDADQTSARTPANPMFAHLFPPESS